MHCLYQPQVTQGVSAGPQATKGWQGSDRSRGSLSSVPDNVVTAKDPYTSTAPKYVVPIWSDMNEVDPLHDPDPIRDKQLDRECDPFSGRGWRNMAAILLLCFGLIVLFAGYPVLTWFTRYHSSIILGYNLGGINGSGQVPTLPNLPG